LSSVCLRPLQVGRQRVADCSRTLKVLPACEQTGWLSVSVEHTAFRWRCCGTTLKTLCPKIIDSRVPPVAQCPYCTTCVCRLSLLPSHGRGRAACRTLVNDHFVVGLAEDAHGVPRRPIGALGGLLVGARLLEILLRHPTGRRRMVNGLRCRKLPRSSGLAALYTVPHQRSCARSLSNRSSRARRTKSVPAISIGASAVVMIGAHHILPGVGLFDRAAGGVLRALLTIVLAIAGVSWQDSNIAKWIQMLPMGRMFQMLRQKTKTVRPDFDSAIGERIRPRARISKGSVREAIQCSIFSPGMS
jgi:hypothetical protein